MSKLQTGFTSGVLAVAAFGLTPLPEAQAQLTLTRSGGLLGEPLHYTVVGGAPDSDFIVGISGNAGPTSFGGSGGGEGLQIDLGLELTKLWTIETLDSAGAGSKGYLLPADVVFQGFALHAQAFTFPGAKTFIDEISNRTALVIGQRYSSHATLGVRGFATDIHTSTVLADGRVFLAGGLDMESDGDVTAATEIYLPSIQEFVPGPVLPAPRAGHSATLLADGRVLLVGGVDSDGTIVSSTVLFDPASGAAQAAAPMLRRRMGHTATRMLDGRVLVVGGLTTLTSGGSASTSSTEVFDPVSGTWSLGPALPTRLSGHAAALDGLGRVVVVGGFEAASGTLLCLGGGCVTNAVHLIALTHSGLAVTPGPPLPQARALLTLAPLSNGDLIAVGGVKPAGVVLTAVPSVNRFEHASISWDSLPDLNSARIEPNVVQVHGGHAVLGGLQGDLISLPDTLYVVSKTFGDLGQLSNVVPPHIVVEPTIEVSDEEFNGWSSVGTLLELRQRALSVAVDEGFRILTTGASVPANGNLEQWVLSGEAFLM